MQADERTILEQLDALVSTPAGRPRQTSTEQIQDRKTPSDGTERQLTARSLPRAIVSIVSWLVENLMDPITFVDSCPFGIQVLLGIVLGLGLAKLTLDCGIRVPPLWWWF